MIVRDNAELEKMKKACEISKIILDKLCEATVEGSSHFEINELTASLCKQYNVVPAFKGVRSGDSTPFPGNLCVSVNDETMHTIPFSKEPFKNGDIVKVDFGIIYNDIYTDHCKTIGIGTITDEEQRLIDSTKLCIDEGVKRAVLGNTTGDISNTLQTISEVSVFKFVRGGYSGHGIGKTLWDYPNIPYYGKKGIGKKLEKGMVLCVEIQLTMGSDELFTDNDGWTIKTVDGSKSAMFEQMVMVDEKPLILTGW